MEAFDVESLPGATRNRALDLNGTTLFISRAGADAAVADEIGRILESAGYTVILQQWDFANRNFMERMHAALAEGAHVVALLSPDYLRSDHCAAEWMNALAGDPLNRNGRLILIRVAECEPPGLLAGLAYWDVVPLRDNRSLLSEVVLRGVGGANAASSTDPFRRAPRTIVDAGAIRPTAGFAGREDELAALAAALDGARALVALHGAGGMGKSSLAREYAWRHRDEYAVIWWLDAQTESGIVDRLIALGALFVRDLDQLSDRRAAAKQVVGALLGGFAKPVLFVFDNLEDERLLHEWLPPAGAKAIATSRTAHWGGDVHAIGVRQWTTETAAAYLMRESGRRDIGAADAARIAEALDGLPLALSHAAAYLKATATVTAERYLMRIGDQLRRAPRGAGYPRSVFATFEEQLRRAESEVPGAAAVACFAAFFAPDAIPEELLAQPRAAYAAGLVPTLAEVASRELRDTVADSLDVDESLGALDQLSLIAFAPATRTFSMHRLVQAAARGLLDDATPWIATAVAVLDAAFPADTDFVHWPACARFEAHVVALADVIAARNLDVPEAAALLDRAAKYLKERGRMSSAERLARQGLALREATLGPGHLEVAESLQTIGNISSNAGHYADAIRLHERALAIRRAAFGANHELVANSLNNIAVSEWNRGRPNEALALFDDVLRMRHAVLGPEHPYIADSLSNRAFVKCTLGRFAEAEHDAQRALALRERLFGPGHPDVALSFSVLGEILEGMERIEEAELRYEAALRIRDESLGPDHPLTAASLHYLARIRYRQARYDEAVSLARRALGIVDRVHGPGHPDSGDCLVLIGRSLAARGSTEEGERAVRDGLAIHERAHPTHQMVADDLEQLADLLAEQGRADEAASLRERARAIREP